MKIQSQKSGFKFMSTNVKLNFRQYIAQMKVEGSYWYWFLISGVCGGPCRCGKRSTRLGCIKEPRFTVQALAGLLAVIGEEDSDWRKALRRTATRMAGGVQGTAEWTEAFNLRERRWRWWGEGKRQNGTMYKKVMERWEAWFYSCFSWAQMLPMVYLWSWL